jgi:hypothetical protein
MVRNFATLQIRNANRYDARWMRRRADAKRIAAHAQHSHLYCAKVTSERTEIFILYTKSVTGEQAEEKVGNEGREKKDG